VQSTKNVDTRTGKQFFKPEINNFFESRGSKIWELLYRESDVRKDKMKRKVEEDKRRISKKIIK
jgi:hypothetical protein